MQQNENFAKQAEQAEAEAERPEVEEVSEFKREDIARSAFETAMADGISLDSFLSLSNTLAARYDRIVGALRADRDSWAEQAEQRLADWDEMRKERDAALARVAELELKLDKSDYAYDNDRIHMRGLAARAIARAKVFDDGSDGADAESARSVVAILRELLAVGPAQAQHSVPEGYALIPVRETEAMHDAVMALLYKGVARTDTQKLLDAYLAAAPGKEVPQAWLDVQAERRRQITAEGWTPEHDDGHACDEIAAFACYYAMPPAVRDWDASSTGYGDTLGEAVLPEGWEPKTGDRRRELIKACALALAEIERLDRAAPGKEVGHE
ncbi:hypothetical protein ACRCP5_00010 [Pseudomonas aeruginosa]